MATENPASQHARFLETARALKCDEDEAAFDEKLKAVVGPKTPGPTQPRTDENSSQTRSGLTRRGGVRTPALDLEQP